MDTNAKSFNRYVVGSILVSNEFGIKAVNDIEDIRDLYLDRQQYSKIVELIKKGDINAIREWPDSAKKMEYFTILKFSDQNKKEYIVTVYDNDELTQDPQVIDLFALVL